MHAATRRFHWVFDVYILVITLVFILPFAQVYHILIDSGWNRGEAIRASLLCELVYFHAFWRGGDPLSDSFGVRKPADRKISVPVFHRGRNETCPRHCNNYVGQTFGLHRFTVYLPYSYLSLIIHQIREKEVVALGEKLRAALVELLRKEPDLMDNEVNFSARLQPTNTKKLTHAHTVPGLPQDVVDAEERVSTLFVEYNDAAAAWHDIASARTRVGRFFTSLGAPMLLLRAVRVLAELFSIYSHLRGANIGPKEGALAVSDRLHRLLVKTGVKFDVNIVYQYATFGFNSILMSINLRAVLLRMASLVCLLADHDAVSGSAAIFIAHLMGRSVISSTFLLGSRRLRSAWFQSINFGRSWEDGISVLPVVVGGLMSFSSPAPP